MTDLERTWAVLGEAIVKKAARDAQRRPAQKGVRKQAQEASGSDDLAKWWANMWWWSGFAITTKTWLVTKVPEINTAEFWRRYTNRGN